MSLSLTSRLLRAGSSHLKAPKSARRHTTKRPQHPTPTMPSPAYNHHPTPTMPSPAYNHLANLPTELLLLITAHLRARSLCNLAATCRALLNRLDYQRTARFAAASASPTFIYRLVKHQWRCGQYCRVPDNERRLAVLNYAADKGSTEVVRRLVDYHGLPVEGMCCGGRRRW
ncbi:uncharacterized protein H6S33_007156 [Morchella sextelata]|uniref:uncharacterized protein n=1 Tax=Morchella sextelata TaxID=1174677 RepID=UPI001D051117|nr:uncharacterized protein H6S33_007156 [Morchella sextelata]KAH0604125.1 hypothetical protein H6S33_007156 [Morchella sextelata]